MTGNQGILLCDLNKREKYCEVKSENRGRVDQVKAWEIISQKVGSIVKAAGWKASSGRK